MDDFVKIQGVFSDLYFQYFEKKLKGFDKKRKLLLIGSLLSVIFTLMGAGFLFVNHFYMASKLPLYFIVIIPFFLAFFGGFWHSAEEEFFKIDKVMKQDLMPRAAGKLAPILELKWGKNSINQDSFNQLFKAHNLLTLNSMFFKMDDCFMGSFHDIKFQIYEISNKYNLLELISAFCSHFFMGFIWAACIGIFPGGAFYTLFYEMKWIPQEHDFHVFLVCYAISVIGLLFILSKGSKKDGGLAVNFDFKLIDLFKGLVVEFEMKKDFKGHTVIFENNKENALIKNFLTLGYEKVTLEDVEFNKKFSIYTTNQVEARYVLTTGFMEKLKNLKQSFKSKYIRASFNDGKLVLAIQADKDLFRIGSPWRKTDTKMYQTMFIELVSILKITDTLNLENQTGL